MYVSYFDEVKSHPDVGRNHYIVGGVAVPIGSVQIIDERLSALSEQYFGSKELRQDTEFHASQCYTAKGPFKGRSPDERLQVFREIFALLSGEELGLRRVYAAIDTSKIHENTDAAKLAFLHFVERTEKAVPNNERCILVADLDDEQDRKMVADHARYRRDGTPGPWGQELVSVCDSVYFGRSHHSRLLQLADFYVYLVASRFSDRKGWFAERFLEVVAEFNVYAHRYKEWPNS